MIRSRPEDATNEREVAVRLETAWKCKLHHFGRMNPVDWYAERDGRVVAFAELKRRTHGAGKFPTVYLALRKVVSLLMAAGAAEGTAPLFVVGFDDAVKWVDVRTVPLGSVKVLGRRDRGAANDLEPIIEVPVAAMREVAA